MRLTAFELSKELKVSKRTVLRWIQAGLTYYCDAGHSQRFLFDLDEVKAFIEAKQGIIDSAGKMKIETGRRKKVYRVFNNSGIFQKNVIGSKAAIDILRKSGKSLFFKPYAIDENGRVYVYYQNSFRLYNPEKHGGLVEN